MGGFLRRDSHIEASKLGYAWLIEQNIRRGDVTVNNAALVYVRKRAAELPRCPEKSVRPTCDP